MKISVAAPLFALAMTAAAAGAAHAGDRSYRSATARIYYKAAVEGSADAQARLGALFVHGDGVARSDTIAFQWLLRAADQGHPRAQLMLSEAWSEGRGVPRNYVSAYKWAYLAQGNAPDQDTRDRADALLTTLTRLMSAAEVDEAKDYAAAWKPRLEVPKQVQPKTSVNGA
jgi:TPR repeat protein